MSHKASPERLEQLNRDLESTDNCVPLKSGRLMGLHSKHARQLIKVLKVSHNRWMDRYEIRKRMEADADGEDVIRLSRLDSLLQVLMHEKGILTHMNAHRPVLYRWVGQFDETPINKYRVKLLQRIEQLKIRLDYLERNQQLFYGKHKVRLGAKPGSRQAMIMEFIKTVDQRIYHQVGDEAIFTAEIVREWALTVYATDITKPHVWCVLTRLAQGGVLERFFYYCWQCKWSGDVLTVNGFCPNCQQALARNSCRQYRVNNSAIHPKHKGATN